MRISAKCQIKKCAICSSVLIGRRVCQQPGGEAAGPAQNG
jgi:hypothetical protein